MLRCSAQRTKTGIDDRPRHHETGQINAMLLLIDNYDSFTFNLAQYLGELEADVLVRRNDEIGVGEAVKMEPESIIISPGPCTPDKAGICVELILKAAAEEIPVLGICLGHQAIGSAFGARVTKYGEVVHGKTDSIHHEGSELMDGLPSPFRATRYHSLIVDRDTLPDELSVVAWNRDGIVMGLQHRELPIFGLQFHPESIASEHGHRVLAAFLKRAENSG